MPVIFLRHELNQIDDTMRISVFVVVPKRTSNNDDRSIELNGINAPRDQFDEIVAQGNAGLGIEDRRMRVANEIRGNHFVIGIT